MLWIYPQTKVNRDSRHKKNLVGLPPRPFDGFGPWSDAFYSRRVCHMAPCRAVLPGTCRGHPTNCSTSDLEKARQNTGISYILTDKCASRHRFMNFFNIRTSKSASGLHFFTILTSKRAFRHSSVQFFDIRTSKRAPTPPFFKHFDFKCAFRHSCVQFLISPLTT